MNRKNFPTHKQILRAEAGVRSEARAKRSPSEQLQALDDRLGMGVGARKERRRLNDLIQKEAPVSEKEPDFDFEKASYWQTLVEPDFEKKRAKNRAKNRAKKNRAKKKAPAAA